MYHSDLLLSVIIWVEGIIMEYKVIRLPYINSKRDHQKVADILNKEAEGGWMLDHILQPYIFFGFSFGEHSAILKRE